MTLPTAGGPPRVLFRGTRESLQQQTGVWTCDGKHILAAAGDGPRRTQIMALPADGGEPRARDISVQGAIRRVDLSPDGGATLRLPSSTPSSV